MFFQKLLPQLWIACLLSSAIFNPTFAQEKKFGKVSKEELKMSNYAPDPEAEAVVLFDVGQSTFEISPNVGFQIVHTRHTRIKIFNKSGYEHANISIPFYDAGSDNRERVSNIKGYTYALENGEVQKYKLDKSAIFEEEINENWRLEKFTMPNVAEGVIIEFEYKVTSDFVENLREWYFQNTIPVMWSEYVTRVPEYFAYKRITQGFVPFTVDENETQHGSMVGGGTNANFTLYVNRLVAENVPAFRNEKYITTAEDYLSKIDFQLTSMISPNGRVTNYSEDWKTLSKGLRESESFGVQLRKRGLVKDEAALFQEKFRDLGERAEAVYEYIKRNITWDGKYRIYASEGLRKALNDKKGNSAEVNLLLTSMLSEAGIEAYPVLLSTRSHGRVNPLYPSLSKFNYVITYAKIGEKGVLLDATDHYTSFGSLPYRCLNGDGLVITEESFGWVPLQGNASSTHSYNLMLKMDENGQMKGEMQVIEKGYAAISMRKGIEKNDEETYISERWNMDEGGFKISKYEFKNLGEMEEGISLTLDIETAQTKAGNLIYLDPILEKSFEENPFKQEERKFPVDFGYPFNYSYFLTIELPKGYKLEELPQNGMFSLPDKAGRFSYIVGQSGNNLQVRNTLSINKPYFSPNEYAALKKFFELAVSKINEQIVLKKATGGVETSSAGQE